MRFMTKFIKKRTCPNYPFFLVVLCILTAIFPQRSYSIGLLIPNQDAAAIARGNAFAATADNPSAIYYNPAGITQIPGTDLQVGYLNYLGINVHYDPNNGGESSHTKFQWIYVPQVYLTHSFTNMPISVGLGVYSPFGLGVQWPEKSTLRSLAMDSKLTFITLNPVIAWKILPSLSLAAGPTFNYGQIIFTRGLETSSDYFRFDGDNFSYGFNAGLLWQPHPKWSFGLNYRLTTSMDFSGHSSYAPVEGGPSTYVPTTAHVPFPQTVSGGISFRPTPKWNLEFDVDYINWDSLNTITLSGTKNIFGFDLPLQLNWRDSWQYKFGVTRYFEKGWYASAGYFYSTETAPNETFTPAVPDTALNVASLGFGHEGNHWHWALAGQLIIGPQRNISTTANNQNPFTGATPAGKYQLVVPTLTISVGYRF